MSINLHEKQPLEQGLQDEFSLISAITNHRVLSPSPSAENVLRCKRLKLQQLSVFHYNGLIKIDMNDVRSQEFKITSPRIIVSFHHEFMNIQFELTPDLLTISRYKVYGGNWSVIKIKPKSYHINNDEDNPKKVQYKYEMEIFHDETISGYGRRLLRQNLLRDIQLLRMLNGLRTPAPTFRYNISILNYVCPKTLVVRCSSRELLNNNGELMIMGVDHLELLSSHWENVASSTFDIVDRIMEISDAKQIFLGENTFWTEKSIHSVLTAHANSLNPTLLRTIKVFAGDSNVGGRKRNLSDWQKIFSSWLSSHKSKFGNGGKKILFEKLPEAKSFSSYHAQFTLH